jgi:hypothetical protein
MTAQQTAIARAAIGLAQGIFLFLLYEAVESKAWPATAPIVFSPLLLIALFVPLVAIAGLSNLRLRTLVAWVVAATAVCAGLAVYDIWSGPVGFGTVPRLVAQPPLWPALTAGLFILHSLIAAGEADRRFVATYPRYFDISWKQGVQMVLAVLFVGVFWGLLWLGAELFKLIQLNFLADLIKHRWFWIPVTTLATASALHVTDSHAGLVRGARTLKLTLLSWLLPMMALFAVVFVFALPFTGLEPLWSTRRATFVLLTSAAALVFLINASYQDGKSEIAIPSLLRYARVIAAIVLVPLVALAGYGLWLRIQQYGWTPQRITALACFIVLACYALGYVLAAATSGTAMRLLQATNVATAYVVLAVLLAIFSPVADPSRIAVADQLARLESGKTTPDQFDYKFLRFQGGRYGMSALRELAARTQGADAALIARRASQALLLQYQYQPLEATAGPSPQTRAANITVVQPPGQTLPEDFLAQEWTGQRLQYLIPRCLTVTVLNPKCEAVLADIDGDGTAEILLLNMPAGGGAAFKRANDGKGWVLLGAIANAHCQGVREALRGGQFTLASSKLQEIEVAGARLRINTDCPPPKPPS